MQLLFLPSITYLSVSGGEGKKRKAEGEEERMRDWTRRKDFSFLRRSRGGGEGGVSAIRSILAKYFSLPLFLSSSLCGLRAEGADQDPFGGGSGEGPGHALLPALSSPLPPLVSCPNNRASFPWLLNY